MIFLTVRFEEDIKHTVFNQFYSGIYKIAKILVSRELLLAHVSKLVHIQNHLVNV